MSIIYKQQSKPTQKPKRIRISQALTPIRLEAIRELLKKHIAKLISQVIKRHLKLKKFVERIKIGQIEE